MSDPKPQEQCCQCGRDLPETTPGPDGFWYVTDGQPLGCGCAGAWSCDGEVAYQSHDDEGCIVCRECTAGTCPRCASTPSERARLACDDPTCPLTKGANDGE